MAAMVMSGLGAYLPKTMHTNDTLPPLETPPTAAELEKIGVLRRGWADADEGVAEMAARAAGQALERAGVRAADLDLIILSNWTQRRYLPDIAPKLKQLLGADKAFAFDVATACAGFIYGVATAHGFLQSPRFSTALVAASETTSVRGRPGSRATLVFGDAAGAAVLQTGKTSGTQILDYELYTDGTQHDIMTISEEGWVRTHVKQQELIALTQRCISEVCSRILKRNALTLEAIDWIVPHSGTAGVQAALLRTLAVPPEKVLTNFATVGNVSSAAVPVALDAFLASGKIQKGQLVLSPAVGSGFYAAAMLYRIG